MNKNVSQLSSTGVMRGLNLSRIAPVASANPSHGIITYTGDFYANYEAWNAFKGPHVHNAQPASIPMTNSITFTFNQSLPSGLYQGTYYPGGDSSYTTSSYSIKYVDDTIQTLYSGNAVNTQLKLNFKATKKIKAVVLTLYSGNWSGLGNADLILTGF